VNVWANHLNNGSAKIEAPLYTDGISIRTPTQAKAAMPAETIFSKIIRRELPSDIVYQDAQVTAFRDINPQAPVHILIVPNKLIPTANDVLPEDEQLIGHMFVVARTIAAQEGIAESGYRLLVNCNRDGGQEVYHLHLHLLGGRRLGPMLVRQS
jgi:histidine triad (HIT) family protein